MDSTTLLADPASISLEAFVSHNNAVTIVVRAYQTQSACPLCQQPSSSLHSNYIRSVSDLPWHGVAVKLELQTRKFRCRNELCKRKVFCERLPKVVEPYSRRTIRLNQIIEFLALTMGARASARAATNISFSNQQRHLFASHAPPNQKRHSRHRSNSRS